MNDSDLETQDNALPQKPPAVTLLEVFRMLMTNGDTLWTQGSLHLQLARVEWLQQKQRLMPMILALLVALSGLICLMLFSGVALLILSWNSPYLPWTVLAVWTFYLSFSWLMWRRFTRLSGLFSNSFAHTRAEIAADLAMLRRKL